VIHTDFEKGFIKAETVGYDDFIECGGEKGAKEKGVWRLEGGGLHSSTFQLNLSRF